MHPSNSVEDGNSQGERGVKGIWETRKAGEQWMIYEHKLTDLVKKKQVGRLQISVDNFQGMKVLHTPKHKHNSVL